MIKAQYRAPNQALATAVTQTQSAITASSSARVLNAILRFRSAVGIDPRLAATSDGAVAIVRPTSRLSWKKTATTGALAKKIKAHASPSRTVSQKAADSCSCEHPSFELSLAEGQGPGTEPRTPSVARLRRPCRNLLESATREDYHRKYLGPDPDALGDTGGRCAAHGGLAQTLLVPDRIGDHVGSIVSDRSPDTSFTAKRQTTSGPCTTQIVLARSETPVSSWPHILILEKASVDRFEPPQGSRLFIGQTSHRVIIKRKQENLQIKEGARLKTNQFASPGDNDAYHTARVRSKRDFVAANFA